MLLDEYNYNAQSGNKTKSLLKDVEVLCRRCCHAMLLRQTIFLLDHRLLLIHRLSTRICDELSRLKTHPI